MAEALRRLMERGLRGERPVARRPPRACATCSTGCATAARSSCGRARCRTRWPTCARSSTRSSRRSAAASSGGWTRRPTPRASRGRGGGRRRGWRRRRPQAPDPDLERMLREIAAKRLDTPRLAAARRRRAGPPAPGLRLHGRRRARSGSRRWSTASAAAMLDRLSEGLADAVQGMKPEDLAAAAARWSRTSTGSSRGGCRATSRAAGGRRRVPRPARRSSSRARATLDDVVDQLADRMAAMQSLMRSLTPEQRAELQDTIDALLRDDRLRWDLAQLAANLDQLLPDGLGERVRFGGDQPLGPRGRARAARPAPGARPAGGATSRASAATGDLADIDRGGGPRPARARTPPATSTRSRTSRDRLEQAGYLDREGDRMELTPRGSRRIGQKVLDELFARLRNATPSAATGSTGPAAAATARRRPSRSSSGTRSTSTCGRR